MVDDNVLNKWLAMEMTSVNRMLVTSTRPIGDLVREDAPALKTRSGDLHVFDKAALERVHAVLGPLARRRMRVPVTFWVDKDVPNMAAVQELAVVDALKALGRVPESREVQGDKFWIALSLAQDISNSYPTVFQFAFY